MNWNCRSHFIDIQTSVTVELDRSDALWFVLSINDRSKQEDDQEQHAFHLRIYLFFGNGIREKSQRVS